MSLNNKLFISLIILCSLLLLSACSSTNNADETASNQTMSKIAIMKKGGQKDALLIDDQEKLKAIYMAFENRERRYEKLMPLFEHQMSFEMNGVSEIWRISPSGYLMKNDSSELYKMDMSNLIDYMK